MLELVRDRKIPQRHGEQQGIRVVQRLREVPDARPRLLLGFAEGRAAQVSVFGIERVAVEFRQLDRPQVEHVDGMIRMSVAIAIQIGTCNVERRRPRLAWRRFDMQQGRHGNTPGVLTANITTYFYSKYKRSIIALFSCVRTV